MPGAGAEDAASGQPADSAQSAATVEGIFGAESEWEAPGAAEEGSNRPADAAAGAPSKRQQRRQQQREESAKRSRNRGPSTGRGQGPRGRGVHCYAFVQLQVSALPTRTAAFCFATAFSGKPASSLCAACVQARQMWRSAPHMKLVLQVAMLRRMLLQLRLGWHQQVQPLVAP